MLKSALVSQSTPITALFSFSKPFLHGNNHGFRQIESSSSHKKGPNERAGSAAAVNNIKAIATSKRTLIDNVTAVITVKSNSSLKDEIDESFLFGKSFSLELVSTKLDHKTGSEKTTKPSHAIRVGNDKEGNYLYESKFNVPFDFGEVGAIYVENEHRIRCI
ncbi:lipoxygenase 7, chloroplastic-like isoform X1 [Citrus clementina]|uniref:lipoxygenase 7, chloroplastic-like isoform X1 n=1 Tax=Citrus clementina TaxID=85681 RepID=UPI000CED025D|nr:lipoxygenase 7, chloroplastic-like isoform X1 [Citrus x clementina]